MTPRTQAALALAISLPAAALTALAQHELTEATDHHGTDPGYHLGQGTPGWVTTLGWTCFALAVAASAVIVTLSLVDAHTARRAETADPGRHRIHYAATPAPLGPRRDDLPAVIRDLDTHRLRRPDLAEVIRNAAGVVDDYRARRAQEEVRRG